MHVCVRPPWHQTGRKKPTRYGSVHLCGCTFIGAEASRFRPLGLFCFCRIGLSQDVQAKGAGGGDGSGASTGGKAKSAAQEPPAPTPAKREDVVFDVTDKNLQKVMRMRMRMVMRMVMMPSLCVCCHPINSGRQFTPLGVCGWINRG